MHQPMRRARVLSAAERAKLTLSDDPLDQNLVEQVLDVGTLAAGIADRYTNPACEQGTVGEAFSGQPF